MDLSWRFDFWFRKLPTSPKDAGSVHRIVRRLPGDHGQREVVELGRFTHGDGLVGDRWKTDDHASPTNQVTLINVHVLRSLCAGDEARMALSGDNLQVDLDLSEASLPIGTRLAIGSVVLEVTPEVHRPCSSFADRFGVSSVKKVARATRVGKRGRGVMCSVVQEGELRSGDSIDVQRVQANVGASS
ncbi:MAG: MOSC domain-containing protein YiiM [Planctomycetota bacterium]|jgi:MOSC domain-containing protein YiiM